MKSICLLSKSDEVITLWHTRLEHVNHMSMALMHKHKMVYGLPNMSMPKQVCKGCLISEQTRKVFPKKSSYCATKVLQLVRGDLCGPIEPTTSGGNKYSSWWMIVVG